MESDAKSGAGTKQFAAAVKTLLADKLRAYAEKGQNRVVRVMILGVPNVGKSTFINRIAGRKTAKTEDRPGVTRAKQWVPIDRGLELLDTPGILWPKFEDQSVGLNLAYTGAADDLGHGDPGLPPDGVPGHQLSGGPEDRLQAPVPAGASGRRGGRGLGLPPAGGRREKAGPISGGEVDTERMAKILLDEYRAALGRLRLGNAGEDGNSLQRQNEGSAPMNCPSCGRDGAGEPSSRSWGGPFLPAARRKK